MSCECDRCGLEEPDCQCYVIYLEERISSLEERLDVLQQGIESLRPRSWLSEFRDAKFQENLLQMKFIEKLEENK